MTYFLNALFWAFLTVMFHGLVNNGVIDKFVMRLYSTYLGIGLASVAYHRLQTDNHNLTAPEKGRFLRKHLNLHFLIKIIFIRSTEETVLVCKE